MDGKAKEAELLCCQVLYCYPTYDICRCRSDRSSGYRRSESAESAYMTSSLRQNIVRAAAMCYAAEGAYPEELSYLEENYGITVNEEKYTVHYSFAGSNISPEVTVTLKKGY